MFNDGLFSEGLAATLFQMAGVEEFLQRERASTALCNFQRTTCTLLFQTRSAQNFLVEPNIQLAKIPCMYPASI